MVRNARVKLKMTTGEKIARLRTTKNMSQEALAIKLDVSRQTIYKWESDEAMPTKANLSELTKILDTTFEYLMNDELEDDVKIKNDTNNNDILPVVVDKPEVVAPVETKPENKQVSYICDRCNKIITDQEDMVRVNSIVTTGHVHSRHHVTVTKTYCKECKKEIDEEIAAQDRARKIVAEAKGKKRRILAIVMACIAFTLAAVIGLSISISSQQYLGILWTFIIASLFSCFVGCMFLYNNIVVTVFLQVAVWGFVKFPGIIFTFDFDGLEFLIVVKILFAILGFMLAALFVTLGIMVGMALSPFVMPFAIRKNIKYPAESWSVI